MDNVVKPREEMAVKLFTASSGRRPSSVVQNPDQRDFLRNVEDTPLITAFNRTKLNINDYRNDETKNNETAEIGNFPAHRSIFDWRMHTYYSWFNVH